MPSTSARNSGVQVLLKISHKCLLDAVICNVQFVGQGLCSCRKKDVTCGKSRALALHNYVSETTAELKFILIKTFLRDYPQ